MLSQTVFIGFFVWPSFQVLAFLGIRIAPSLLDDSPRIEVLFSESEVLPLDALNVLPHLGLTRSHIVVKLTYERTKEISKLVKTKNRSPTKNQE